MKSCTDKENNQDKETIPGKDILTPIGNLSWKKKEDEGSINADEMFNHSPVAGSAGVEC